MFAALEQITEILESYNTCTPKTTFSEESLPGDGDLKIPQNLVLISMTPIIKNEPPDPSENPAIQDAIQSSHLDVDSRIKADTKSDLGITDEQRNNDYIKCPGCHKLFSGIKFLVKHITLHHPGLGSIGDLTGLEGAVTNIPEPKSDPPNRDLVTKHKTKQKRNSSVTKNKVKQMGANSDSVHNVQDRTKQKDKGKK